MFCPKCGNKIPEGGKFCNACGNKVPQAAAQPDLSGAFGVPVNVPASKPEKKTSINWKVLIILLVVGALIIGAGIFVLTSDFDFEDLFGGYESSDDDDDRRKDDKDKDDEEEDEEEEGEQGGVIVKPDDPSDETTGPRPDETSTATLPEPSYPVATEGAVATVPTEPMEEEVWNGHYIDGLWVFIPAYYSSEGDNYFYSDSVRVYVTPTNLSALASVWETTLGNIGSVDRLAAFYHDYTFSDGYFWSYNEATVLVEEKSTYVKMDAFWMVDETVWWVTIINNNPSDDTIDEMYNIVIMAELE